MALCPFVIVIDSAEQAPWRFDSMRSRKDGEVLKVQIRRAALGRHPNSKGDYSIYGMEDRVGVERKSRDDGQATILSRERLERFESELFNLSKLQFGLVVVECSLSSFILNAPTTDYRTAEENAKVLLGNLMSLQDRFRVPWIFADTREFAAKYVFRFFERAYRKAKERKVSPNGNRDAANGQPGSAAASASGEAPASGAGAGGAAGDAVRTGDSSADAGDLPF